MGGAQMKQAIGIVSRDSSSSAANSARPVQQGQRQDCSPQARLGPGAVADPNPIAIRAVKALFGESPNQQVTYAVGAEGKRRRTSLTDLDQIKMLHEANLEKTPFMKPEGHIAHAVTSNNLHTLANNVPGPDPVQQTFNSSRPREPLKRRTSAPY
mmetsp:Transcript_38769/g.72760  ORF Transcript_38769/g.72760 Transcript_38769/m.72760 type:complete len:155 (+) Transcript_38769:69-533(+)